ncbi:MAG TPA: zinc-binding alcohol dehydrogenase family protein [Polyangiaceae bacterium]|jgi:NADPH:quinone reductase-like Zn-dependent oxidoreductase|nr:zinc-binding alcohol dehydrogenase family protein [Polyangiaceae bacterium]
MQALRFERTGALDALVATEVAAPEPEPGDVVVRVVAAGLNPSDVKNVEGHFPYTTVPRTPGRDFSGVIARGPADLVGVAVFATGKELGFTRDGAHAEYVAVTRHGVSRKPDALGFEQAACVGVPYTTAWSAFERSAAAAGTSVVVIGAAGAVGRAAMDLAAWRGARAVGAVRRREQVSALEARGHRAMLVEHPLALPDRVFEAFPSGAEVIFDTTGAFLEPAVSALAPEGRIAVIAAPQGGRVEVPVLGLYRRGGVVVGVNSLLYDSVACARFLERIAAGFDSGRLPPPEGFQVTPFSQAISAYHAVRAGGAGKLILVMGR